MAHDTSRPAASRPHASSRATDAARALLARIDHAEALVRQWIETTSDADANDLQARIESLEAEITALRQRLTASEIELETALREIDAERRDMAAAAEAWEAERLAAPATAPAPVVAPAPPTAVSSTAPRNLGKLSPGLGVRVSEPNPIAASMLDQFREMLQDVRRNPQP